MALKMRQSLSQWERDFREEAELDRDRREQLRREAVRRSRKRTHVRARKRSSMRYWVLVLTLAATAVSVTGAMFESLYLLLSETSARGVIRPARKCSAGTVGPNARPGASL